MSFVTLSGLQTIFFRPTPRQLPGSSVPAFPSMVFEDTQLPIRLRFLPDLFLLKLLCNRPSNTRGVGGRTSRGADINNLSPAPYLSLIGLLFEQSSLVSPKPFLRTSDTGLCCHFFSCSILAKGQRKPHCPEVPPKEHCPLVFMTFSARARLRTVSLALFSLAPFAKDAL